MTNTIDPITEPEINVNEVTRETLVAVIRLLSQYIDWSRVDEADKPLLHTFIDSLVLRNNTPEIPDVGY